MLNTSKSKGASLAAVKSKSSMDNNSVLFMFLPVVKLKKPLQPKRLQRFPL
jgi:hypothetical protein